MRYSPFLPEIALTTAAGSLECNKARVAAGDIAAAAMVCSCHPRASHDTALAGVDDDGKGLLLLGDWTFVSSVKPSMLEIKRIMGCSNPVYTEMHYTRFPNILRIL